MAVYIASDCPLPTSEWDANRPGFHVTELIRGDDQLVRQQVSKPFVYYLGAHSGCGCGFQEGQYGEYEDGHEALIAGEESRRLLLDYVTAALMRQPTIELFACWEGDQGASPLHRRSVRPAELFADRCYFLERELVVVSEQRDAATN